MSLIKLLSLIIDMVNNIPPHTSSNHTMHDSTSDNRKSHLMNLGLLCKVLISEAAKKNKHINDIYAILGKVMNKVNDNDKKYILRYSHNFLCFREYANSDLAKINYCELDVLLSENELSDNMKKSNIEWIPSPAKNMPILIDPEYWGGSTIDL